MASIIMSKSSNKLDPSVKKMAFTFLEKLTKDDTAPGLNIEPITHSADSRVRTGRVDKFYRAVLFKITGSGEPTYVFHGIWPHDDAIAVAKKTTLSVNPINGITEIRTIDLPTEPSTAEHHGGAQQGVWTDKSEPTAPVEPTEHPLPVGESENLPEIDVVIVPLLESAGVSAADLTESLGLDSDLAAAALRATSEDELLDLATNAVEWQGLALIDLASGHSVDEVQARLSLDEPVTVLEIENEDEALLRGFEHAAAKLSFTYIEDDDALRRAIDEGDFGAWRVFLHPEQRRYVTGSWNGPFRLAGGAGTGKTVVVLHRARALALKTPGARVITTTYTTNLAEAMKRDLLRLDPQVPIAGQIGDAGVYVAGIDALAVRVLKAAGTGANDAATAILGAGARNGAVRPAGARWGDALDIHGDDLPAALRSPAFFEAEYTTVVLPGLITSEAEYLKVRRPGRGVALDRTKRKAVWKVIAAYRNTGALDQVIDFDEAAAIAAAYLNGRFAEGQGHVADHVLVDEGQDLSPARWQLLRALAGTEKRADDLFIAEDSHQRIYGQKVVLSRYGIQIVGRSRRLTLNYRTTAQNLAFALEVLAPGEYVDLDDEQEKSADYRSARSGPKPALQGCANLGDEYGNAAEVLRTWLDAGVVPETIAVLVRDGKQRDKVVAALGERGVEVRPVDREAVRAGLPVAMTMHRSKGTEFSRVLLFGLSDGSIPSALHTEKYSDESWADAMLRERSLLYVASTRARDELAVSWSGKTTPLLAPRTADSVLIPAVRK